MLTAHMHDDFEMRDLIAGEALDAGPAAVAATIDHAVRLVVSGRLALSARGASPAMSVPAQHAVSEDLVRLVHARNVGDHALRHDVTTPYCDPARRRGAQDLVTLAVTEAARSITYAASLDNRDPRVLLRELALTQAG